MSEEYSKVKNCIDRFFGRKYLTALYLAAAAVSIVLLALIQPFGDPPDEINRFKVVYFIANHGTLPNGYDAEVILDGYGGSYAFQPILSYIFMGYLVRFLRLFTQNAYVLVAAARMVNLVFGVAMAYYVLLIARKLWEEPATQWLFSCMVTFLPMNLFMHSYINTDSMSLLSTAMIVYGMLLGEENDYDKKTCILLGVGAALCAMSYYNAYAIVLVAMLWFFAHFAGRRAWKKMFAKGGLIAGIILLGAGWWFIRNGILYGGDLLGMNARMDCAVRTALPEYNPRTRFTFYGAGLPVSAVFAEQQYAWLTFESMIAMFGPMSIPTHGLIYIYYKRLVILSLLAALLPWRPGGAADRDACDGGRTDFWEKKSAGGRVLFGALMALDCLITMGLHLYYSYTWEYQPQGRYLLPMVIPAGYLMAVGIKKLSMWLERGIARVSGRGQGSGIAILIVHGAVLLFIGATFAYTIFVRVLPVYINGSNLMDMMQVPFGELGQFWG